VKFSASLEALIITLLYRSSFVTVIAVDFPKEEFTKIVSTQLLFTRFVLMHQKSCACIGMLDLWFTQIIYGISANVDSSRVGMLTRKYNCRKILQILSL